MPDNDVDTATKLRYDFYKNIGGLALAALGGEITLVNTVFQAAGDKKIAYVSYVCLFLASMSALGAQEALLNQLAPPHFRTRAVEAILKPRLRTPEAQYIFEGLSAILLGIGVAIFATFGILRQR